MNMDIIFGFLFLAFASILLVSLLYVFIVQRLWGKPILKIHVKRSKYYKLTRNIYYVILIINLPAFLYDIIQNNNFFDTSEHFFFIIMSIFFIYQLRASLNVYNEGINYMNDFIKWEKIMRYKITDNIIKFELAKQGKELVFLVTDNNKNEIEEILASKL